MQVSSQDVTAAATAFDRVRRFVDETAPAADNAAELRRSVEVLARHIDALGASVPAPDEAGFFTIH